MMSSLHITSRALAAKDRIVRIGFRGAVLSLAGSLALCALHSGAQIAPFGRVKEFSFPEFYDPPQQNQMKSLLAGAEALPQANGTYLIKELRLETFRENGEKEVVALSRECIYDPAARTASSASRLQVQTGDGQLFIEGEGFFWRQTNASLIISNQVRTVIRRTSGKIELKKP